MLQFILGALAGAAFGWALGSASTPEPKAVAALPPAAVEPVSMIGAHNEVDPDAVPTTSSIDTHTYSENFISDEQRELLSHNEVLAGEVNRLVGELEVATRQCETLVEGVRTMLLTEIMKEHFFKYGHHCTCDGCVKVNAVLEICEIDRARQG